MFSTNKTQHINYAYTTTCSVTSNAPRLSSMPAGTSFGSTATSTLPTREKKYKKETEGGGGNTKEVRVIVCGRGTRGGRGSESVSCSMRFLGFRQSHKKNALSLVQYRSPFLKHAGTFCLTRLLGASQNFQETKKKKNTSRKLRRRVVPPQKHGNTAVDVEAKVTSACRQITPHNTQNTVWSLFSPREVGRKSSSFPYRRVFGKPAGIPLPPPNPPQPCASTAVYGPRRTATILE